MAYSEKIIPVLHSLRPLIMPGWGNAAIINKKDDLAVSVVTAIDIEIEKLTRDALSKLFPKIGFVGEECGGNRNTSEFWLMDPIDGTAHYIRGLPFCTTMIALVQDGKINFSAIYDFVNDHMFFAERGKGAFRDETRLHVSTRSLQESYLCWETHLDNPENMKIFLELRKKVILCNTITAGWECAMIAEGKYDGRITFDPHGKDYDFSPGSLLIEESGGVCKNLYSESYDYRNTSFIAANPKVYEELTSGFDALFPIRAQK